MTKTLCPGRYYIAKTKKKSGRIRKEKEGETGKKEYYRITDCITGQQRI